MMFRVLLVVLSTSSGADGGRGLLGTHVGDNGDFHFDQSGIRRSQKLAEISRFDVVDHCEVFG